MEIRMVYVRGKLKRSRKAQTVRLYKKQKGLCYYCRGKMTLALGSHATATLDHRVPRSSGRWEGKSTKNIVAACLACNQQKGAKSESEFLDELAN